MRQQAIHLNKFKPVYFLNQIIAQKNHKISQVC